MKKILALLCAFVICCTVLLACAPDDLDRAASAPNTEREAGFPAYVEPLYETVEGERIPFMKLCTLRAGAQSSEMLVMRSANEVNAAIEQGYFPFIGEDAKALLLGKNYDLYQIVAIRYTGGAPYREVAELVVNQGSLGVVRRRYLDPLGHYADVHYDEYTLCLIQKSDVGFSAPDPFALHFTEHLIDLSLTDDTDA